MLTNNFIKIFILIISIANCLAIVRYKNMIKQVTTLSEDYFINYGCWCGLKFQTKNYKDVIDYCCYEHAICIQNQIEEFRCSKTAHYNYRATTGTVLCTDSEGSCKHNMCTCDKHLSECFFKNIQNYNPFNKFEKLYTRISACR